MADFLTDSDDEKKVDELLSQAMDLTVLEQVAAINCSGFNDSDLPSHLETRFQKLKSFPVEKSKVEFSSSKSFNCSKFPESNNRGLINEPKKFDPSEETKGDPDFSEEKLSAENGLKKKNPDGKNHSSPSKSSDDESFKFSPFKKNPHRKMRKEKSKSPISPSSDGFSSESLSPPAKTGCLWCSPKKGSRKSSKGNRGLDLGLDWGKNDELLSDLSNFSSKNREKIMRNAMKEEEKICREAEKIVKWAKQASARMEVSDIEDELSDNENFK